METFFLVGAVLGQAMKDSAEEETVETIAESLPAADESDPLENSNVPRSRSGQVSFWPTADRDSLNFTDIEGGLLSDPLASTTLDAENQGLNLSGLSGKFVPSSIIGALLGMDGLNGRSDEETSHHSGIKIERSRRPHKALERGGVLRPDEGVTRLSRLGRILRTLKGEHGLRKLVAQEALGFLCRYQSNNPVDANTWPEGCKVHPYWAVLYAACRLDNKIHWDEVNRELMRATRDSEIDEIIGRIQRGRRESGYDVFIGGSNDGDGPLRARTWPAAKTSASDKNPVGQVRDQRFTPFLKLAGFGELLLRGPGSAGRGYWSIPEEMQEVVLAAVSEIPENVEITDKAEWIDWLYEGRPPEHSEDLARATTATAPPPDVSRVIRVQDLILSQVRKALDTYDPDLLFSDALIASVVAALRAGDGKNFIILRGVSGTGKTRLVAAIAKAIYGMPRVPRPFYTPIEVRPDWLDGTPVLGYMHPITKEYVTPRFLAALRFACEAQTRDGEDPDPVFVCLDEMNLAPVELYFAECLSAMESGNDLALDLRDSDGRPTEIRWPKNLYVFGTINIDETTSEISDKVLDRAQVIDTSDISLSDAFEGWLKDASALDAAEKDLVRNTLVGVWDALRGVNRQFGFRSGRAMVRFVNEAKSSSGGVLNVAAALDAQLAQKVLVKLRGEGEKWSQPLATMRRIVAGLPVHAKSLPDIDRMIDDHARLGSFQFWN